MLPTAVTEAPAARTRRRNNELKLLIIKSNDLDRGRGIAMTESIRFARE
jgi:hypothetical protein